MWSTALDAILTTLRYLAPATLLTIFWGQQSFLFKILKHIDSALRAIVFSSEEQKQTVLQWLAEAGPVRVEHLDTVWRHGWILCGVLDGALPGACAGHPPTRLSLKHAQGIAEQYLGVESVFSRQELDSNDSLSKHQEWKLATYLDRIRQALAKLTPPVSKPSSQRTSPEFSQFTYDYVARGSGLIAAQINYKTYFKIYPTSQQCLDPGEIHVLIKGPKDTYGMGVVPPILGKAQSIRQKMLGLPNKRFTENALPITHGATYLRAFGKTDMNKTYHIPQLIHDIKIEVESLADYAKIGYLVGLEGKYEISITSRGLNIMGSPFLVTASKNILKTLEMESFCLEDGEEIDIVDVETDRKVVIRIVDFVTEKMLLKENGTLEKISDEEANILMCLEDKKSESLGTCDTLKNCPKGKFKKFAKLVVTLNRVSKAFQKTLNEKKKEKLSKEKQVIRPKSPQVIPDIVNSTFSDINKNPFLQIDLKNKIIVPEHLTMSLKLDNPALPNRTKSSSVREMIKTDKGTKSSFENNDCISKNPFEKKLTKSLSQDVNLSKDSETTRKFNAFFSTDYQTNNSQTEEVPLISIKILNDETEIPLNPSPSLNPFIDSDVANLERPKTPVLKIITGDLQDRKDSVYVNPNTEEILGNEFVNPFFMHQHHQTSINENSSITDFIIGAPVSTSPIIRSLTPEPTMQSIIFIEDLNNEKKSSIYSTPENINTRKDLSSSTFHSLDSVEYIKAESSMSGNTDSNRNISPKKDMWDSAYVSIDDNNSTPDSNNNDNNICNDLYNKNGILPSGEIRGLLDYKEVLRMGPAERELWETCNDLQISDKQEHECFQNWKVKRSIFTPILEESDKSSTSNIKKPDFDMTDNISVTTASTEMNKSYKNKPDLKASATDNVELFVTKNDFLTRVDSASVNKSDVKRPTNKDERKISEVQPCVTESSSASHILSNQTNDITSTPSHQDMEIKGHIEFGEKKPNIVLERKKYWDEKIKEIEAKSININKNNKTKPLKTQNNYEYFIKIKGLETENKYLPAAEPHTNLSNDEIIIDDTLENKQMAPSRIKLVQKWKKYWDDKLTTEIEQNEVTTDEKILTYCDSIESGKQYSNEVKSDEKQKVLKSMPVKQEIPEEIFKAFEISPKRFFGTSRKRILNRMDSFLGKQSTDSSSEQDNSFDLENGLVSSRISLFHNISQAEDAQYINNINYMKSIENSESNESYNDTNASIITLNGACPENIPYPMHLTSVKEKRRKLMHYQTFNRSQDVPQSDYNNPSNNLHKSSISKSEMDIFNKKNVTKNEYSIDYLERRKSYEELPKINVKNFISLFETVSKSSVDSTAVYKYSSTSGLSPKYKDVGYSKGDEIKCTKGVSKTELSTENTNETVANSKQILPYQVCHQVFIDNEQNESPYLSLSDIDVQIIDKQAENSLDSCSDSEVDDSHQDYRTRFKRAKNFFKSLEELHDVQKPFSKSNECEMLLHNKSIDSCEKIRTPKRVKKNIKSNSMPSSEIAKIWKQLQDENRDEGSKLVKISEKFNVDDLFNDVMDGKLSRQGSLRGIPHKKAVLETFRSMENVSDTKLNSYEIAIKQLKEVAKENHTNIAQTYLNEYPFLPKTEPSKYQSRFDAKASGLITLRELLNKKPRRNSVPDLRLNTKFTVNL